MTAPNGSILFNNSTGSDTAASGLGAANVYGTGASTTGASASVTGITTTGVTAGDLLWVQSSSGRQFRLSRLRILKATVANVLRLGGVFLPDAVAHHPMEAV